MRAKHHNTRSYVEKSGLKHRYEREGGVGVGQNACTRSCVEGYWGKIGAKIQFSP